MYFFQKKIDLYDKMFKAQTIKRVNTTRRNKILKSYGFRPSGCKVRKFIIHNRIKIGLER